jgi:hypothetical protein
VAQDQRERPAPFFIFGSPRSGTTLLAECLNAHTEVVVPFETDFIVPLAFVYDRIRDPKIGRDIIEKLITHSERFGQSLGEYLDTIDVHDVVYSCDYHPGAILNTLYKRLATKANKKLAGDKSPNDLLRLRILIKTGAITPSMRVLHIVRDIRDVMVSLNQIKWVGDLDLYFPRSWSNSNLYLHTLFRGKNAQYLLIRYEDMVREPEKRLAEICSFLGVEFQDSMLSPSNRNPRYREMGHHSNLFRPISPDKIGVYRKMLDRQTQRSYEVQAHEALKTFGYTTSLRMLLRRLSLALLR